LFYRFTARGAAASLAPLVFSKLDDNKKSDIVNMLSKLSDDDAPAVRRSVAKSLSSILPRASQGSFKELVDLYQRLSKDDQDSIRIQIIPASIVFMSLLPWDIKVQLILHGYNLLLTVFFFFLLLLLSLFSLSLSLIFITRSTMLCLL
jgi:hypothetical protein